MPDNRQALIQFSNACNPYTPAPKEMYVDCTSVRGRARLEEDFIQALSQIESQPGEYLTFLFSGHIGSGKSSEIAELKRNLESENRPTEKRYFPIVIDTQEYLNEEDASIAMLLGSIAVEITEELNTKLSLNIKPTLPKKSLQNVFKDLGQAEIEKIEMGYAGSKIVFGSLKGDSALRDLYEIEFGKKTTLLREALNELIARAEFALREKGYDGLMILLDNMEKLRKIRNHETVEESHYAFFIENADTLQNIKAHKIFTIPLSLLFQSGGELRATYGTTPVVLPMIAVTYRGEQDDPYAAGYRCMEEILRSRLPLDIALKPREELSQYAFEEDALSDLIKYSGGHLRSLFMFARQASIKTKQFPITLNEVNEALDQSIYVFNHILKTSWYDKLVLLENSGGQIEVDEDIRAMLRQTLVLEYWNGYRTPPRRREQWFGVHPLVREMEGFARAKQRLEKQPETP